MTRTRPLMLLSLLLLAGCPTKPDDPAVQTATPAPDAGTAGAAGAVGTIGTPEGSLPTLQIASPVSGVSTNGTVAITVDVTDGAAPASITLLEDGAVLATIAAPAPYNYSWDTKSTPDGTHTLVAQATVDGKLIASAPVTVLVDRTAPTVTSTTPAPGATNVVLRAPITVTFSEPILATSFTSSAVSLQVGAAVVPTTATLSADGKSATVAIGDVTSFSLPATFSLTLATTLTDLVGNPLKAPTSAWSWNVPDWIKYAPIASSTVPALAVGPNFQPVIAYTRCLTPSAGTTCVDDVFVAASDGHAWNSLGQVPSLVGPGSLDLDAQGHPIVAGIGVTPNPGFLVSLLLATWNGSSWDGSIAPLGIDYAATPTPSPIVRLDPSGRPVVAWKDAALAYEADVGVARWTGTAWDKSFGKLGLTNVNSHSLLLDGNGYPIVGFSAASGSGLLSIRTAGFRAWNGTSWTSGGAALMAGPFFALDQASEPMMVQGLTVEHYSGGTWLPVLPTSIPASSTAGAVHLTAGADHQPVVAWVDTTAPARVGLARWTGAQWTARAGLFNAGGVVTDEAPGVLVDARGSVWVSWREGLSVNVWMSNY